jgi:hypothetical protein
MKRAIAWLCVLALAGLDSCALAYDFLGKYPAPRSVSASKGDTVHPEYVLVSWSPVAGAETYGVGRSTDLSQYAETIGMTDATTYQDYDVEPGRSYYYVVFVAEPAGIGLVTWKNGRSPEIDGRAPAVGSIAAPQNFWASNGTYAGHIQVGWHPVPEADCYVLYREEGDPSSSGGVTYAFVARFEKSPYSNATYEFPLDPSDPYGTYAVRAFGNGGFSELSNSDYGYWQ